MTSYHRPLDNVRHSVSSTRFNINRDWIRLLLPPHPGSGAKYCNRRVCVSACLSVRSHVSKTHDHIALNFPNMLPVTVIGPSRTITIRYVLPVLWMTSCFHITDGIGQNQRDDTNVSSSLPGGGNGTKSAICDCVLLYLGAWAQTFWGPNLRKSSFIFGRDSKPRIVDKQILYNVPD